VSLYRTFAPLSRANVVKNILKLKHFDIKNKKNCGIKPQFFLKVVNIFCEK